MTCFLEEETMNVDSSYKPFIFSEVVEFGLTFTGGLCEENPYSPSFWTYTCYCCDSTGLLPTPEDVCCETSPLLTQWTCGCSSFPLL